MPKSTSYVPSLLIDFLREKRGIRAVGDTNKARQQSIKDHYLNLLPEAQAKIFMEEFLPSLDTEEKKKSVIDGLIKHQGVSVYKVFYDKESSNQSGVQGVFSAVQQVAYEAFGSILAATMFGVVGADDPSRGTFNPSQAPSPSPSQTPSSAPSLSLNPSATPTIFQTVLSTVNTTVGSTINATMNNTNVTNVPTNGDSKNGGMNNLTTALFITGTVVGIALICCAGKYFCCPAPKIQGERFDTKENSERFSKLTLVTTTGKGHV